VRWPLKRSTGRRAFAGVTGRRGPRCSQRRQRPRRRMAEPRTLRRDLERIAAGCRTACPAESPTRIHEAVRTPLRKSWSDARGFSGRTALDLRRVRFRDRVRKVYRYRVRLDRNARLFRFAFAEPTREAANLAFRNTSQARGGQRKDLRWRSCDVDVLAVVTSKNRDRLAFKAPAASVGISCDLSPQPLREPDGTGHRALFVIGSPWSRHNQKHTILVSGAPGSSTPLELAYGQPGVGRASARVLGACLKYCTPACSTS
jgi:hypothetical protein